MVQNIVAGLVVVGLLVIGSISYAQEHHECWNGHLIRSLKDKTLNDGHRFKALKPCGSMAPEV
ncbi:hypothetical protein [Bradyrhizobium elkanii]|uniref:hypothetical protein n=1 Tax=Bradyrhizobium elkanii TaxID=29448 RepID=UPI001BA83D4C|nr:hypothetical protein [Bradyrhizobium elkanii]MBR1162305.1 hypothetical protein [Bradyrhizobium elkanii]